MFKLSINPASDPFPFAALVLAYYLKDIVEASTDFGLEGSGSVLTRTADGTQIDDGESIVRTLSKAADVESNSTQVCITV